MKNWKAITVDWTALQDYDHVDEIGVCLTQRQVAILKAVLVPMYWSTRWENLTATSDELDAFVSQIDSQLDGNDCEVGNMEFRDNPLDICEVQYSNDGGDTWTTMFRKDVCVPKSSTTTTDIDNVYTDITNIENNHTTWNNNITNIAPQWAYVDEDSDKALCYVIDKYVDWICDIAIKQIETDNETRRSENDWLDDVAILLTELVMDVVIAVAGTITISTLVIGAVAYASVQLVEAVWDHLVNQGTDFYQDQDAREVVKCYMYNHLKGATPQYEDWAASLETFDYIQATDAEGAIATTVNLFNQEVDVFINYMLLMEDVNGISNLLPICDCPQPLIFDQLLGPTLTEFYGAEFTSGTDLALQGPGNDPAVCRGTYDLITDRFLGVESSAGGTGCNIRVVLPDNVLVTKLQVHIGATRQNAPTVGDRWANFWAGDPNTGGTLLGSFMWGAGFYTSLRIQSLTFEDVNGLTATPVPFLYLHNSMDKADATNLYQWIHVECIPYVP